MKKRKSCKWLIPVVGVLAAVITIVCYFCFLEEDNSFFAVDPTVSIETPGKISASNEEVFDLDVKLTTLEEALYPAASFRISFDPSKLEFVGVKEGNVPITDSNSSSGYQVPGWSVNTEKSNEIGQINLMYLDMTGGKYAFTKEALAEDNNILFRLCFRLRGAAMEGDVYELCIEDAVFANADEDKSLATATGSLKAKNGRIVVGE